MPIEVSKKNNFSAQQTAALENEILFVLVGFESETNLKDSVKQSLFIPDILARDIAEECSERIFKDIADILPKENTVGVDTVPVTPNNEKLLTPKTSQAEATTTLAIDVAETPSIPRKIEVNPVPLNLPVEKPNLDILAQQNPAPTTTLEKILAEKPTSGDDVIILDRNYKGQDPYREQV